MALPLSKRYKPMDALPAREVPEGPEWQYEPKWDGFRCLAFRDDKRVTSSADVFGTAQDFCAGDQIRIQKIALANRWKARTAQS